MGGKPKKVFINPKKKDGTKRIVVSLNRQLLFVYQTGEAIVTFDCVSGDKDHATPPGHYTVIRKVNPCFSTEFKVPMDHALFFHQSHVVGPLSYLKYVGIESIGSHGCVRLAEEDATWLFNWADVGTPIWIRDDTTITA